jgi:hypothetical protein
MTIEVEDASVRVRVSRFAPLPNGVGAALPMVTRRQMPNGAFDSHTPGRWADARVCRTLASCAMAGAHRFVSLPARRIGPCFKLPTAYGSKP